jgi:hypothetical protein
MEEITTFVKTYRAFDGTIFNKAKECLEYESLYTPNIRFSNIYPYFLSEEMKRVIEIHTKNMILNMKKENKIDKNLNTFNITLLNIEICIEDDGTIYNFKVILLPIIDNDKKDKIELYFKLDNSNIEYIYEDNLKGGF